MNKEHSFLRRAEVPFTQVSNTCLDEDTLSWKAKGIYSYLSSKATIDGWRFRKSQLIKASKDGKASFEAGIKELKDIGLLEIYPRRREDGTLDGWEWKIYYYYISGY